MAFLSQVGFSRSWGQESGLVFAPCSEDDPPEVFRSLLRVRRGTNRGNNGKAVCSCLHDLGGI